MGADNGIGLSSILAVLESETLRHGPVEALFTNDEETGMTGANGLKAGFLKGEILLNTDSEQEYEIYVGCAGGINIQASFRYRDEPVNSDNDEAYSITVSGLKGGHSGIDIHLGRANANKLLFRFLSTALKRRKRHLFGYLFHGCVSLEQQSKTARDLAVSSSVTVRPSTSLTLPEATALTARG